MSRPDWRAEGAADGGDDAGGDGGLEAQGVADGDDELAGLEGGGVAEGGGDRGSAGVDADDGQVGVRVFADEVGAGLAAVGEGDADLPGVRGRRGSW